MSPDRVTNIISSPPVGPLRMGEVLVKDLAIVRFLTGVATLP